MNKEYKEKRKNLSRRNVASLEEQNLNTQNMLRYIAYCRKSTEEKNKQILSIEAQIAELREFAKRENLNVIDYITESKTAKVPGREGFAAVLKKIEKGEAEGILSWHADRLARNSIDGGKIIYLLDTGKLKSLKFPTYRFENSPQGKFFLSIAFGQSKYYVDNLSENVKRGNRQKLRRGIWPGKAPLGYYNEPKLRTIEVEPKQAKIVKKAFQLFADGSSFTDISEFLFKRGVSWSKNKPLKVTSVRNMLTNKFYIGVLKYAGEYYEATHKCFISKKLFNKVQKQVENTSKPRKKGHNFPFTGLATCGECGAAITAEQQIKHYPNTRGKVRYVYYHCTKKLGPCNQKYLREEKMEKQLINIVAKCGLHKDWQPHFADWIEKDRATEEREAESKIKTLKEEVKLIEQKLNKLLDGYLDGVIEEEIYKQKKNEFFEEKLKLEERIAKIKTDGVAWLEPMEEFINSALRAQKIARAKNKSNELKLIAQKVGLRVNLLTT